MGNEKSTPWSRLTLPESPRVANGLPLWAASPDDALAVRTDEDNNAILDLALLNRYQGQQPWELMTSYSEDLMPRTKVPVHVSKKNLYNPEGDKLYGDFDPASGMIRINGAEPMSAQMATFPHELGHAADALEGYSDWTPTEAPTHHKYFTRFEPEMAQSLDAQRALEHGWPVNPEVMARYPWLKKVRPESSNRLASPWDFSSFGAPGPYPTRAITRTPAF